MRRRILLTAVLALVGLTAITVALALRAGDSAAAVAGSERATGSLNLNASLDLTSKVGDCPVSGIADECVARTITGSYPGLGQISAAYSYLVDIGLPACAGTTSRALSFPIHLVVASKGEIHAEVAETSCVEYPVSTESQRFTITGGTGIYAAA